MFRKTLTTLGLLAGLSLAQQANANSCPKLYEQASLKLSFNPAFLHIDEYDNGKEGLAISSFFNKDVQVPGGFFQRDLVAVIDDVNAVANDDFNEASDLEIVSDLDFNGTAPSRTVWPNSVTRAPDGLVPFEALIVPQGFLRAPFPGRLTLINLDDPNKQEYLIHQSVNNPPASFPSFYHNVVVVDMDEDGYDDIVSVRSYFSPILGSPPFGDLVWFKNPGPALDPAVAWQETVLFGGPTVGFQGPDIHLTAHDFEGDGRPEFVATHFFTGPNAQAVEGKISIYGAPVGAKWSDVNPFVMPVRVADISVGQGLPFDLQMVDLNQDGKIDILASNHQPDACRPFPTVPGRVYALEMPASGNIFQDPWPVHILLDNIRPQPSLTPGGLGRLAPGKATAFYPDLKLKAANKHLKPSIVVGGDEAAKVWVLTPQSNGNSLDWMYDSRVIFDINDYYGPNTSQTETDAGITISTMGAVAVGYKNDLARLYIPVFEGREILVYSFENEGDERVECVEDELLACPAF